MEVHIKEFVKGMRRGQFLANKLVKHAVVRNLEIIGEASKNLSKGFLEQHKGIPWSDIMKMRDKVIHFYFGINYDIVWVVVQRDIPVLEKKLGKIAGKSR